MFCARCCARFGFCYASSISLILYAVVKFAYVTLSSGRCILTAAVSDAAQLFFSVVPAVYCLLRGARDCAAHFQQQMQDVKKVMRNAHQGFNWHHLHHVLFAAAGHAVDLGLLEAQRVIERTIWRGLCVMRRFENDAALTLALFTDKLPNSRGVSKTAGPGQPTSSSPAEGDGEGRRPCSPLRRQVGAVELRGGGRSWASLCATRGRGLVPPALVGARLGVRTPDDTFPVPHHPSRGGRACRRFGRRWARGGGGHAASSGRCFGGGGRPSASPLRAALKAGAGRSHASHPPTGASLPSPPSIQEAQ